VRLSHPDEWFKRWKSSYGTDAAIQLMEWNNQPAETFFRINPLVPCAEHPPGLAVDGAPGFFRLDGPLPNQALASGGIYIQDPATRHCVELLDPKPGESVLDACAAPGGKAFLIAASSGGGQGLVCTDSNEKRLPRLAENLTRLHVDGAETLAHDWTQPAPSTWIKRFDAILLDVPCSNTGVMRRRVDVRWRFKPADLPKLRLTQLAILENALPCLKPGGRIVYSTCSIEPEENIDLIQVFLSRHPELALAETKQILPFRDATDGAFAACLRSA
jgi:16S rRNA (cytosine967-C5)-methyltransferase